LCRAAAGSATWAERAYEALHPTEPNLVAPDNVACTGAKTEDLIDANDKDGTPEWTRSAGSFGLVTFTFGGNDIGSGLASVLEQCVGLWLLYKAVDTALPPGLPLPSDLGHTCPAEATLRAQIAELGAGVGVTGSYRAFLTEVATQVVSPGGNIVVLGYPELVEDPKFWSTWEKLIGACWGISAADATELRGVAGDLNATIGQAVADIDKAAPHGVHLRFVDVNTGAAGVNPADPNLFEPSAGTRHNLCSADSWINGWSSIDWVRGSFHPKQEGLDHEGALAASVISGLDWSRLTQPTQLVSMAPVDSRSHLKPGFTVAASLTGTCAPGSDVVSGAYRCFGTDGGGVFDPCWYDAAKPATPTVDCLDDPWTTQVTRIVVLRLDPIQGTGSPRDYPWAVMLTNGARCVASQGAHGNYQGRVIDYQCGANLQVLRGLHQIESQWTVDTVIPAAGGTSYQAGPVIGVTTAYLATPSVAPSGSGACTAANLAHAAATYERQAGQIPMGTFTLNAHACGGGYAIANVSTTFAGGEEFSVAYKPTLGGWTVLGISDLVEDGEFGIPPTVVEALNAAIDPRKNVLAFPETVAF
jgi:hypothetical protein